MAAVDPPLVVKPVILKNLYRNGNKVPMMFRNGELIYQMLQKQVFSVDTEYIEFLPSGGTHTITITANDDWVMTLPVWLTASSISGMSSTVVTITATQQSGELTGEITITCGDKEAVIEVVQGEKDYSKEYFTIEALAAGNFIARNSSLYYSINNGEWTVVITGGNIPLSSGDKVRFKGNSSSYQGIFSGNTIQHKVYGNVESLLYGDNFVDKTSPGPLGSLFYGSSGLVDASNLVLPATSLAQMSYSNMFRDCTNLISAPVLPATTLADYCYASMFRNCTSLIVAPELIAPTLNQESYSYMFNGCTNLNYIKCTATNNSAYNCTIFWLNNVAASGTFVKKRGVSWQSGGTYGIPDNWTVEEVD